MISLPRTVTLESSIVMSRKEGDALDCARTTRATRIPAHAAPVASPRRDASFLQRRLDQYRKLPTELPRSVAKAAAVRPLAFRSATRLDQTSAFAIHNDLRRRPHEDSITPCSGYTFCRSGHANAKKLRLGRVRHTTAGGMDAFGDASLNAGGSLVIPLSYRPRSLQRARNPRTAVRRPRQNHPLRSAGVPRNQLSIDLRR
jgi:hypothetical protein